MTKFVNKNQQDDFCTRHQSLDQNDISIPNRQTSGVHPLDFIRKDEGTRLLDYFASFIQHNMFTMSFVSIVSDLLPLISTSPVLYHAVIAVGALNANRHTGGRALKGEKSPYVDAMTSYHKSMGILRSSLGNRDVMQKEDVLWATFFLGLFEVFFLSGRASCSGCIKHMFD